MFIRAVTGACLLSVMIASIWFGIYTVGAIILLISLLALLEFYRLFTCAGCKVLYIPGILTSVFAFLSVFLHATGIIQLNMVLSVCLPFCVLIFVAQLFSEATMAFESAAFYHYRSYLYHAAIICTYLYCCFSNLCNNQNLFALVSAEFFYLGLGQ